MLLNFFLCSGILYSVFLRLYAFLLLDKVHLALTPSLIFLSPGTAHPGTSSEMHFLRDCRDGEFAVRRYLNNTTLKDE